MDTNGSLFSWQDEMNTILSLGQTCEFRAGDVLSGELAQADKILVLIDGRVEVSYRDRDNPEIILTVLEPGEPVFENAWQKEEKTGYILTTLEDTKAIVLSQKDFSYLIANSTHFSRSVFHSLSRRIRKADQKTYDARTREELYARLLTEEKRNKHIEMAGSHNVVKKIRQLIKNYGSNNKPVYLMGEKGTGKELVAWLIHQESPRSQRPFIVVDCTELAEDELGERLFGSLHGLPQSGALYRFGYLELARGGSILFKDIDRLSPLVLIRLAAFLENNFLDVRFMACSRKPINQEILGDILEDEIFTQLLADSLVLPPLRDRMRDLPSISDAVLSKLAKKHAKPLPQIDSEAQEKLLTYSYKNANIAELEEILERALVLAEGETIAVEHIFTGMVADSPGAALDILQNHSVKQIIKRQYFPRLPQIALTAGLVAFIMAAFLGGKNMIGDLVLLSAWSLGWPALLLAAAFAGRLTCSICPFAGAASIAQGITSFRFPIPSFFKKYDYIFISFLFAMIFWVEEISDMRHSPVATGLLLLTITSGAVIAAVLYPRNTWCRHICPLGGMVGVCSMVAPVELRSKVDICHHKCTSYSCYKGSGKREGCPLFQHLSFVDNNVACKMCMRCVINCPNDAVLLNLRPPAREIWRTRHINRGLAVFVLVFAALLIPIGLFEKLGVDIPQNIAYFSAWYWATVFIAGLFGWIFIRSRLAGDEMLPAARIVFCLIPLALGAHFAFQLQFVPLLSDLQLFLHHVMSGVPEKQLILITVLSLLRIIVLVCGLVLTLVCLLFARKEMTAGDNKYLYAVTGLALSYFAVMFQLLVGRQ